MFKTFILPYNTWTMQLPSVRRCLTRARLLHDIRGGRDPVHDALVQRIKAALMNILISVLASPSRALLYSSGVGAAAPVDPAQRRGASR
jgi:hypothetical protein